jgi:hypothetical protein
MFSFFLRVFLGQYSLTDICLCVKWNFDVSSCAIVIYPVPLLNYSFMALATDKVKRNDPASQVKPIVK